MKKSSILMAVAGAALTLASCSSTDEPAAGAGSDISISVTAPVASMSRAAVEVPQGYTMRCLLQLLDEQNNAVGQQKSAVIDAATGTGTFIITAAEQELGAKALFWAEYVDGAGKSCYNTADLKAVSYSVTDFNLADAASIKATDAFCGKLDALKDGVNVTLVRPFANVNFTPSNPEKVAAAKKMEVSYTAPAAYNVFNGTAAGTAELTYTNVAFDATATPWFSTFVFAPVDKTALESEMTISLSEGLTQTITIESGKVVLNPNYHIYVTGTIGDVELSDITVSVGVDPGYNVPEAPKFEVGAYVNAAGETVATAAEAVGIVFYEGAIKDDKIENYPAKYAGKTIKGYAVALENVKPTRQTLSTEAVTGLEETKWINGTQGTEAFLQAFAGSAFDSTFTEWLAANPTEGENVTEWYIPSISQARTFFWMLYPANATTPATGSESFRALFPQDELFDSNPIKTVYYAACNINSNGNAAAVRLSVDANLDVIAMAAQMTTTGASTQSALCRPMMTIFE